ncbi:MAG: hypothetical protein IT158_15635 [Bryobacterales bacterium]|nr:hypothetical protein [Bryobacterales bacterium]
MIPVELIFAPHWWFRNCGIAFTRDFYFDRAARMENDVRMRRVLWERFGLGEPDPQPRPLVGSMHVAGGFILPALFGIEIRFQEDQAPWPVPTVLNREQILALRVPGLESTWPLSEWARDMDALEREFGCVVGDFDLDGILNTALHLRGQQLYLDFFDDPDLVDHLFGVIAETATAVARYVAARTGTNSVSCNRSILNVDPRIFLHANCSAQMISPAAYRRFLLPLELRMAGRLRPYGIHHCGSNAHLFAPSYRELGLAFLDVGWGSDVAACRRELPDTFLNLRLSPVRMLQAAAEEIRDDAERLIAAAGSARNLGLCCINMDYGTPDDNVKAMIEVARRAG